MNNLNACYSDVKLLLKDGCEPWQSVELVEEYRQYWKPDKVNVILLAESHVFTSISDLNYKLKKITELENYPDQYARFVYCLAYGEQYVTKGNTHPSKTDGTPQFWKIFYSCLHKIESNESFHTILKSKTSTPQRLKNKVDLLLALKKKGIWLIDTSIIALYDNGKKPDANTFNKLIKTSWNGYTKTVITQAKPKHIIIIGKGVANNIENDVSKIMGDHYTVIPQPQAHLTAEQHLHNFQKYYSICSKYTSL